jgi:O-antigen ligase
VRTDRELRILVVALACAACWQGSFVLYQRYYVGIHRVTGVIGDPNSLSMYLCMVAPVFVAAITSKFPKYVKFLSSLAMLFGGVAIVMTISRTGVMTMGVVLLGAALACVSFEITPKKIGISLLVMLIAAGIVAKSWHTLEERFKESSLGQEYNTSSKAQGRGYYILLAKTIAADRWLGVGLNNWSYLVSNQYGPALGWHFVPYIGTEHWPSDKVPSGRDNLDAAQAAPAHNLGALTLGELGVPGLILFALVWMRWFQMGISFLWKRVSDPTHRMGVGFFFASCGIFLQSLTEWVYRQTPIYLTFHALLGALASLYYIKRHGLNVGTEKELEEEEEWEDEDETVPEEIPVYETAHASAQKS